MRYTILFILAVVITGLTACEQEINLDKERAAIIAVINQETDAYLERDYESVYATHVQDSLNMRLSAGPDSYVFLEGWEKIGKYMLGDETEDDLSPDLHITVEKYNYRMKIYPGSAFVVCDQKWTSVYGEDVNEINSIQVRFLEKIDGEWKISFVSFVGLDGYGEIEEVEELLD